MLNSDECTKICRKLSQLTEEDEREISACIKGDYLDVYRKLIAEEKSQIDVIYRKLRFIK